MASSSGGLRAAAFLLLGRWSVRAKTAEDRKLLELLDPIAESVGFEIVRLRLMGGSAVGRTLQIMAERPSDGDLGIDDCVKLSRAISEVMDAADPVSGEYRLEVSSPGIDRPLTRVKDFEAYEGYDAKLELDRLADKRKRFKGLLAGVELVDGQPHVAIDLEGEEETALVPFAWIQDAKLTLNDELMKLGAERRAARMAEQAEHDTDQEPNTREEEA
jgi:ribosome maturation factor RimP